MPPLPWAVAALTALTVSLSGFSSGDRPDGPVWPVADHRILSGFRPPTDPWGAGHRGVDLPATTGEPVRAAAAGIVSFVGTVGGKPVVSLVLSDGRRLTHEPVRAALPLGARVAAGDILGFVAAGGGHCGGQAGCLHLGLRAATGYTDPLTLLERRPAVLKPWRSQGLLRLADAHPRRSPAVAPPTHGCTAGSSPARRGRAAPART